MRPRIPEQFLFINCTYPSRNEVTKSNADQHSRMPAGPRLKAKHYPVTSWGVRVWKVNKGMKWANGLHLTSVELSRCLYVWERWRLNVVSLMMLRSVAPYVISHQDQVIKIMIKCFAYSGPLNIILSLTIHLVSPGIALPWETETSLTFFSWFSFLCLTKSPWTYLSRSKNNTLLPAGYDQLFKDLIVKTVTSLGK